MHRERAVQLRSDESDAVTPSIERTRGCLNLHLRRVTRQVSRHYDDALRPVGLRVTQFTILAVLAQTGPLALTGLADLLGMERSALARNLKPIQRSGLVEVLQGQDRRSRLAALTRAGQHKLRQALPKWNDAQNELVDKLGPDQSALLIEVLSRLRIALDGRV
jgi:DNA-binding MarR family transcriptional regulator